MKKALLISGVALWVMGSQAVAADLSFPPPMPEPVLPPIASSGGWYLRGDVGVGIESWDGEDIVSVIPGAFAGYSRIQKVMDDKAIVGAGLGYQWNDFLRFDATAEYRGESTFNFAYAGPTAAPNQEFNTFTGHHSAVVGLLNAYYDIGNFWGVLPFIGAGAGFAYHMVDGFNDVGSGSSAGGFGIAEPTSSTDFVWALHAGMDYEVNQNLKLEASYRYLNQGDAEVGDVTCFNVSCGGYNLTLREITSHDMRLGMRWTFGGEEQHVAMPVYAPPQEQPIVRKY